MSAADDLEERKIVLERYKVVLEEYKVAVDKLNTELMLFWRRANFYLLVQAGLLSVLVAILSRTRDTDSLAIAHKWLAMLGVCLVGYMLGIFWLLVLRGTYTWITVWRQQAIEVEQEINRFYSLSMGEDLFKSTKSDWLRPAKLTQHLPWVFLLAWLLAGVGIVQTVAPIIATENLTETEWRDYSILVALVLLVSVIFGFSWVLSYGKRRAVWGAVILGLGIGSFLDSIVLRGDMGRTIILGPIGSSLDRIVLHERWQTQHMLTNNKPVTIIIYLFSVICTLIVIAFTIWSVTEAVARVRWASRYAKLLLPRWNVIRLLPVVEDAAEEAVEHRTLLVGVLLVGCGTFYLLEGFINHHILEIHHVCSGTYKLWCDLGFLVYGAIWLVAGLLWMRAYSRASSIPQRIDYTKPEHAGKPHRGRIMDAEKEIIQREYERDNLASKNEQLEREGHRTIDPSDPEMADRYGFTPQQQGEN